MKKPNFRQSRQQRGGFSRFKGGHKRTSHSTSQKREKIQTHRFVNKAEAKTEANIFIPQNTFENFSVHEGLLKNIQKKGYENPTPIQDQIILHIEEGKDVVGVANTGTGKTGAFLIPIIEKTLLDKKTKTLIVVPTRELAQQIDDEFRSLTEGLRMFSACCVGGARIGKQIAELRHYNHVVIGTPGRLKDFTQRKIIKLEQFNTVVLDEADRMLDMGFIKDVRHIMAGLNPHHQTLFFSATLSKEIEKIVSEFLNDPISISVKTRDTAKNVDQDVVRVGKGREKVEMLFNLLRKKEFAKVLVFVRTKQGAEALSERLMRKGFKADSIHGDKNQFQRQRALDGFKKDITKILVATDVAARGLDIPDVSHVINYDIPATHDDYAHRIGRTGRGEKTGKALTFIDK